MRYGTLKTCINGEILLTFISTIYSSYKWVSVIKLPMRFRMKTMWTQIRNNIQANLHNGLST